MRLTADLTPEEMREEIYDLRRELRPRIREIREFSKVSRIPQYAVNRMREIEKEMRETSVKNMDEKQLRNTLRDLRYISELKTSTMEGAIETSEKFEPLRDKLNTLPEDVQRKFWKVYDNFYNLVGYDQAERFKYELFQSNLIDMVSGTDIDEKEVAKKIEEVYRRMTAITGGGGRTEDARLLFTDELRKLFSEY